MIHLCYLKNRPPSEKNYLEDLSCVFKDLDPVNDFIIFKNSNLMMRFQGTIYAKRQVENVEHYLQFFEYDHVINSQQIDWEKLAVQKLRNILLIEFDDFSNAILRNIINIKSKKTEIVGISTSYVPYYKKAQLDAQRCKDIGMNSDQMSLYLTLHNSLSATIVNQLMEDDRIIDKNVKTNQIESVFNLKNFFKL